jgi:hypothetical protein
MWGVQDKGIDEAFWPIFQMDKVEEGKGSHWSLRLLFAVIIGVGVYGSYTYAPDRGGLPSVLIPCPVYGLLRFCWHHWRELCGPLVLGPFGMLLRFADGGF